VISIQSVHLQTCDYRVLELAVIFKVVTTVAITCTFVRFCCQPVQANLALNEFVICRDSS